MNQVALDWKKVKVGDRVKYHSPVQGNHTGIVVMAENPSFPMGWGSPRRVVVQPITTVAAERGEVTRELITVNHSLWEIY